MTTTNIAKTVRSIILVFICFFGFVLALQGTHITSAATNPCIKDDGIPDPPAECPDGSRTNPCVADDGIPDPEEQCPRTSPDTSGSLEAELAAQRQAVNAKNDCITKKDAPALNKDNCGIIRYLLIFVNVLSGLVGIVVVIMIVVRGIQYVIARENPQMTASARQGILWAILALILYLFVFALLQWIVPGGVL